MTTASEPYNCKQQDTMHRPISAFAAPSIPQTVTALLAASLSSPLQSTQVRAGHASALESSDVPARNSLPSVMTRERLQNAKVFCFDVDSTVITSEGIDELAASCGVKQAVEQLTKEAMGGDMPFHESLRRRLEIMKPRQQQIEEFHEQTPSVLSPRVKDLVGVLHQRGVQVYLLSGGFRQMIEPIADELHIPHDRIYANELRFNPDGSFRDYNPQAWTSTAGGKKRAIEHIRTMNLSQGASSPLVVMVGDGATDLEARDAQDGMVRDDASAQPNPHPTQHPDPSTRSATRSSICSSTPGSQAFAQTPRPESSLGVLQQNPDPAPAPGPRGEPEAVGGGVQGGADLMVGYGGNVVRGKVEAEADWFISDFALLLRALDPQHEAPTEL